MELDRTGSVEREMRYHRPDKQTGRQPHRAHARPEQKGQRFPFCEHIPAGKLNACEDQLNTQDQAREIEGDEVEVLLAPDGVFKGSYPVGGVGGECDTR
jgi:hypothetical protein